MKFWKGFILLWVLFFLIMFLFIYSRNSITGYVPFTGVLKEDPSVQVMVPELNISFEFGEDKLYMLEDISYFIGFEKNTSFESSVDLDYLIFDSENNLVYSEEEIILIKENIVLEKNLDTKKSHGTKLVPGEYVFVLKIVSGKIEKSFSEDFEIEKLNDSLFSLRQLFDIEMRLYTNSFYDLEKFGTKVIFENFGSETTSVNLTFIIYDESDKQVYRKESSMIVETEEVLFEDFEGLDIEPGKYLLVLRTVYNVGVEDYFEQNFEYLKKQTYWFLIIVAAIVVLGLFFIFKERVFRDR